MVMQAKVGPQGVLAAELAAALEEEGKAMPQGVIPPVVVVEKETVGAADTEWILLDAGSQVIGRVRWDGARPWAPPPGVVQVVPA